MTLSLVFTGHMVDLPGRKPPRFLPELEAPARPRIGRELDKAKAEPGRRGFASAGGPRRPGKGGRRPAGGDFAAEPQVLIKRRRTKG
jgi:hypothetical protein